MHPDSRADLVAVVQDVEARGGGAKAAGSIYSLSAAAMPDAFLIRTRETLNRHLSHPFPFADRALAPERAQRSRNMTLPISKGDRARRSLARGQRAGPRRSRHSTAEVHGRISPSSVWPCPRWVPAPTRRLRVRYPPGRTGQISWCHPSADFVRAIHLVGPRGQEWWIERAPRHHEARCLTSALLEQIEGFAERRVAGSSQ